MSLRGALPLAALAVVLAGCDPGWSYRVPGGKEIMDNGREFDISGPSQTSLRAYASLFTSHLWTRVKITNDGPGALEIHPDDVHVADRHGRDLPRYPYRPEPVRCYGNAADVVQLAAGASCEIFVELQVQPDADQLRTVTLTHNGMMRDGAPVPVQVIFEKD